MKITCKEDIFKIFDRVTLGNAEYIVTHTSWKKDDIDATIEYELEEESKFFKKQFSLDFFSIDELEAEITRRQGPRKCPGSIVKVTGTKTIDGISIPFIKSVKNLQAGDTYHHSISPKVKIENDDKTLDNFLILDEITFEITPQETEEEKEKQPRNIL